MQQDSPADAEMKLTDMEFTEMQEGKRFWTLRASEAKYFQDQQRTLLQAVRLTFYTERRAKRSTSRAVKGCFTPRLRTSSFMGDVRAELPNGYVANDGNGELQSHEWNRRI